MSAIRRWYWLTFTAMNTAFRAADPRSVWELMTSRDTSGQMSVQCESMNVRTTGRPRKLASDTGRPDWSVSVEPGAAATGTGDSCIIPASLVLTLAGMPVGRSGGLLPRAPSRVTAKANTVAKATPDTTAMTASTIVARGVLVRGACGAGTAPVSFIPASSFRAGESPKSGYRPGFHAELVALGIGHHDVVLASVKHRRAEAHEPGRLVCHGARCPQVEMNPVLRALRLGHPVDPDVRPAPSGRFHESLLAGRFLVHIRSEHRRPEPRQSQRVGGVERDGLDHACHGCRLPALVACGHLQIRRQRLGLHAGRSLDPETPVTCIFMAVHYPGPGTPHDVYASISGVAE